MIWKPLIMAATPSRTTKRCADLGINAGGVSARLLLLNSNAGLRPDARIKFGCTWLILAARFWATRFTVTRRRSYQIARLKK